MSEFILQMVVLAAFDVDPWTRDWPLHGVEFRWLRAEVAEEMGWL